MQKIQEVRLLNGGVDAQNSVSLIKENMLMNVVNARSGVSANQQTNEIQSLESEVSKPAVSNLLATLPGSFFLLRILTHNETRSAYFFFYGTNRNAIIRYNEESDTADLILEDLVNNLGWGQNDFISCGLFNNLLFYTNGSGEVRYANVNNTFIQTSGTQETLITEPIPAPLIVNRASDPSKPLQLQDIPMQFCSRVLNLDGFQSVLSPFSVTVMPRKKLANETAQPLDNIVNIKFHPDAKIPGNYKQVDIVVRFLNDNTFFVIRSFKRSVEADRDAITSFNVGATPLEFNFYGSLLEAVDATTAAKLFDAIPIQTSHVAIADNRLITANNISGYDTTTETPLINVTRNMFTAPEIDYNLVDTIMLLCPDVNSANEDKNYFYGSIIYMVGSGFSGSPTDFKLYALPSEYNKLRFQTKDANDYIGTKDFQRYAVRNLDKLNYGAFYVPPIYAVREILKELDIPDAWKAANAGLGGFPFIGWHPSPFNTPATDSVKNLLEQIHESKPLWTMPTQELVGIFRMTLMDGEYPTFTLLESMADDAFYVPNPVKTRFFMPGSSYDFGIKYYDYGLRQSGTQKMASFETPDYNNTSRSLVESVTIESTTTSFIIPDWAQFYGVTLTRNKSCQRYIQFAPELIKSAFKDKDGNTSIEGDAINGVPGKSFYGLAIPLSSLTAENLGYQYTEGDQIRLSAGDAIAIPTSEESFTFPIKGIENGHIIIESGTINRLTSNIGYYISSTAKELHLSADTCTIITENQPTYWLRRQRKIFATILIGQQNDNNPYEIAAIGMIDRADPLAPKLGKYFIDVYTTPPPTTPDQYKFTILGDSHTQSRIGLSGGFVGMSVRPNDNGGVYRSVWVDIYGRLAPFDAVGRTTAPTELRWGNAGSFSAAVNGIASFDASDYTYVDINSQEITALAVTNGTSGSAGEALMIFCPSNLFMALVGKQEIIDANGNDNITASSPRVLNTINRLAGEWGCISPRSIVSNESGVFFVDVKNGAVLQAIGMQVKELSNPFANRVFNRALKETLALGRNNGYMRVYGGFSSLHQVYMFSLPDRTSLAAAKPTIPTAVSGIASTEPNPLDFYYQQAYTYVYNVEKDVWDFVWARARQWFAINSRFYGLETLTNSVRLQFEGAFMQNNVIITIPFNDQYPSTKSPLALKVESSRPPTETYIITKLTSGTGIDITTDQVMVADIASWEGREFEWMTYIGRDRLTFANDQSTITFNAAGIKGDRLKGKCTFVVMIWDTSTASVSVTSVSLISEVSSGH